MSNVVSPRVVGPLALALLLAPAAGADGPRLARLEPSSAAPGAPLTLTLHGEGFAPGMKVLIESAEPGRFVAYRPHLVAPERSVVELPLGLGPRPPVRRVLVENPGAGRSEALPLRIEATDPAAGEEATRPASEAPSPPGEAEPAPVPQSAEPPAPSIAALDPATVAAGRAVALQIHGAHFAEGARVWILANRHAGTSRLPEYELLPFTADRVDDTLLELELDRGFYPVPSSRELVVENPDGRRSSPWLLAIAPQEDR